MKTLLILLGAAALGYALSKALPKSNTQVHRINQNRGSNA
jgi:hypothetical protein